MVNILRLLFNNNIVRTYGTQLAGHRKPQIEIWGYNITRAAGTFYSPIIVQSPVNNAHPGHTKPIVAY